MDDFTHRNNQNLGLETQEREKLSVLRSSQVNKQVSALHIIGKALLTVKQAAEPPVLVLKKRKQPTFYGSPIIKDSFKRKNENFKSCPAASGATCHVTVRQLKRHICHISTPGCSRVISLSPLGRAATSH